MIAEVPSTDLISQRQPIAETGGLPVTQSHGDADVISNGESKNGTEPGGDRVLQGQGDGPLPKPNGELTNGMDTEGGSKKNKKRKTRKNINKKRRIRKTTIKKALKNRNNKKTHKNAYKKRNLNKYRRIKKTKKKIQQTD